MRVFAVLAAFGLSAMVAADDKRPEPKGEEVSGKVHFNGKPLDACVVGFHSKDGKVNVATAIKEGEYKATVPAGDFTITISPAKEKGPPVPAKYGDPKTSGLQITIKAGKQTFDIDLTN